MVNATGWNELYAGQPWNAPYVMFNTALSGTFAFALYLLLTFMLYYKTGKPVIPFVIGMMFLYVGYEYGLLQVWTVTTVILINLFNLAWILYDTFIKNS